MSLNNVDSSSGALVATATGGTAVSTAVVQGVGANIADPGSWGLGADVVPVMTGFTTGEFTMTPNPADTDIWKWFDGDIYTGILYVKPICSFVMDMTTPRIVAQFRYRVPERDNAPRDYTIQASHDNVNWDTLLTITGRVSGSFIWYSDSFSNETAYRYYKWEMTDNYNSNTGAVKLYECEFIENVFTEGSTPNTLKTNTPIVEGQVIHIQLADGSHVAHTCGAVTGTGPYYTDTTVSTAGETPSIVYLDDANYEKDFAKIVSPQAKFEFANISNSTDPVNTRFSLLMTANVTGTTVASDSSGGFSAYRGFDNDNTVYWQGGFNIVAGTNSDWVQFYYPAGKVLDNYRFITRDDPTIPKDFNFYGSTDGTNWDLLDARVNQSINQYAYSPYYYFTNTTAYTYYRWEATAMKTDNNDVRIGEFHLYGPVGGDYDNLITSEPIVDGDPLVVITTDNTIHETLASGVTGAGPYEMDTTAITAGEVPYKVYSVKDKISFNNIEAVKVSDTYSGTGPLLSTRVLSDTDITGRTLETKVEFSASGNKCTEISGAIWKDV